MVWIGKLAGWLGISQTIATIGLVVIAISALGLGKCAYDRSIVASHDAGVSATVEREAREREHTADTVTNPVTKQNAADQADRQEAIRNATQAHPDETRRPVGPATSAVVDRLRERQRQAGHAGR